MSKTANCCTCCTSFTCPFSFGKAPFWQCTCNGTQGGLVHINMIYPCKWRKFNKKKFDWKKINQLLCNCIKKGKQGCRFEPFLKFLWAISTLNFSVFPCKYYANSFYFWGCLCTCMTFSSEQLPGITTITHSELTKLNCSFYSNHTNPAM